jgi:hypothetical protein
MIHLCGVLAFYANAKLLFAVSRETCVAKRCSDGVSASLFLVFCGRASLFTSAAMQKFDKITPKIK